MMKDKNAERFKFEFPLEDKIGRKHWQMTSLHLSNSASPSDDTLNRLRIINCLDFATYQPGSSYWPLPIQIKAVQRYNRQVI